MDIIKWRFSRKIWSFINTFLINIYNMGETFKQSLGPSVGCTASKWIHKRTFTWKIDQVWLLKILCNHKLCRGVYWKTKIICSSCYVVRPSTIKPLNFPLELHPLGLFGSALLVMRVKQMTNLSPVIVDFMNN